MTLLEQATHLQELANSPNILDAVDRYYADDVTIVEGDGQTFHGAETEKGRIREFLSSVKEMHGGGVQAIAAHETSPGTGVVFTETSDDIEFHEGGRMQMEQVSVQKWENGKVVHERFYYNAAGMGGEG